jgi:hypothetical protein
MRFAIQFNSQAKKIQNKKANAMLSSEHPASQLMPF